MQRTIYFTIMGSALIASACAASRPAPSLVQIPTVVANEMPMQHLPTGKAALTYNTAPHPREKPAINSVENWIRLIVENAQSKSTPFSPHPDARLDQLAFDVTFALERQANPDAELVADLLAHYGIPNPSPAFLLFRGQVTSDQTSLDPLRTQILQTLQQGNFRRYGFGLRQGATQWLGVLALVEQGVEMDPLPRTLVPGQSIMISGRLLPPFSAPEVLLTPPTGPVRTLVKPTQGQVFKARLGCTTLAGTLRVEILGSDSSGPVVLANFPLYCGIKPPNAVPLAATALPPEQEAVHVETRLFELVNESRRHQGLPLLMLSTELSRIAREYSQEMTQSQAVAHLSKQSGSVMDRVRIGGITKKPKVLAENVGRAYSAREAHQGFMSSPGHRSNILHPMPTHLGIGVTRGQREGELQAFYITQIFAAF